MSRDLIGERGEALFRVAITRWCDGRQWLRAVFLGEKEEGLDFEVVLIDSKVFRAVCYVQVKATARANRYSGAGNSRRLLVSLPSADAEKLGTMKVPAYVEGTTSSRGRPTSGTSPQVPGRASRHLLPPPAQLQGHPQAVAGGRGLLELTAEGPGRFDFRGLIP